MLIDLHAHTSGISKCCRKDAPSVLEEAKRIGLNGIILTNHYQKNYVEDNNPKTFAEKYIKEFDYTKALGDKLGIKVIFGIEVTMELYPNIHMLVYGVDTDFVKRYPLIYDYTQKELYETVKKNGGILIQAHPFRNGTTVLDTRFLDGIEINCHPLYKKSYSKELIDIAVKEKLAVTCGGDYHADTYRPKCGMYLPDDIEDGIALGKYISGSKSFKLCVQEPNEDEIKTVDVNILF